jgi:hypothetical protein
MENEKWKMKNLTRTMNIRRRRLPFHLFPSGTHGITSKLILLDSIIGPSQQPIRR